MLEGPWSSHHVRLGTPFILSSLSPGQEVFCSPYHFQVGPWPPASPVRVMCGYILWRDAPNIPPLLVVWYWNLGISRHFFNSDNSQTSITTMRVRWWTPRQGLWCFMSSRIHPWAPELGLAQSKYFIQVCSSSRLPICLSISSFKNKKRCCIIVWFGSPLPFFLPPANPQELKKELSCAMFLQISSTAAPMWDSGKE